VRATRAQKLLELSRVSCGEAAHRGHARLAFGDLVAIVVAEGVEQRGIIEDEVIGEAEQVDPVGVDPHRVVAGVERAIGLTPRRSGRVVVARGLRRAARQVEPELERCGGAAHSGRGWARRRNGWHDRALRWARRAMRVVVLWLGGADDRERERQRARVARVRHNQNICACRGRAHATERFDKRWLGKG
jgi:hypothetical protein